jgi:hypothetical protein
MVIKMLNNLMKGGETMKIYKGTKEDKDEFVSEVLSPLLIAANTGWYGALYMDVKGKGEYVCLLDKEGVIGAKIDVTADSITAIILDVFKNL